MSRALAWALAFGVALSGCAVLTPFAEKEDYAAYREVRLARGGAERLRAMRAYLRQHPHGQWAKAISRDMALRERELFQERGRSRAGLQLYLEVFPEGPHAAQARDRLAALQVMDQAERARQARRRARSARRRAVQRSLERDAWDASVAGWVRQLASLDPRGKTLAQLVRARPDFARAMGAPPPAACTLRLCARSVEGHFVVPVRGGSRIDRYPRLQVRLGLEQGRVTEASLWLPDRGFSRWYEHLHRQPVYEGDAEARERAVRWATARIRALLQRTAPYAFGMQPVDPQASAAPVAPLPEALSRGRAPWVNTTPRPIVQMRAGEARVTVLAAPAEGVNSVDGVRVRWD